MAKIRISSDVFNICNRIKKIDKYYFIIYNDKTGKFEIHNSKQPFCSYCLTVPYDSLDNRTLNLVHKTLFTKKEELFKEMEQFNDNLSMQNNKKLIDDTNYLLKKIVK